MIIGTEHKYRDLFDAVKSGQVDFVETDNYVNLENDYDIIFSSDLWQGRAADEMLGIIEILLKRVKKQLVLLSPEQLKNSVTDRQSNELYWEPLAFRNFDFTYVVCKGQESIHQIYSFFPNTCKGESRISPSSKKVDLSNMKIAYILPDRDLTGGMKQLLEQMREMHSRGHEVYAYLKDDQANSALPEWSNISEADISGQRVVPMDADFLSYIGPVDIIILGWMKQAPEFLAADIPVVLWEQGSSPLFGDYGRLMNSQSSELILMKDIYQSPLRLMAVSPLMQTILKARFNRSAQLLCAGIDTDFYVPKETVNKRKRILLVGNAYTEFKNFEFALNALNLVANRGVDFKISWACQCENEQLDTGSLEIDYHVMSSQQELVSLYQSADIFLSTSLYEAFSLPPLEAMACKTAVIALNNGGIETYAVNGVNCILCKQGDLNAFSEQIITLLRDDERRHQIAKEGYRTVHNYSIKAMGDQLETNLQAILS